jgi:hypothetical protein
MYPHRCTVCPCTPAPPSPGSGTQRAELGRQGAARILLCSRPPSCFTACTSVPAAGPPVAKPTFVRGKFATIVDYILLPSNCSAENPASCELVAHDSTDVYGVSSNNSPILLPCLRQPPRTLTCGQRRVTLRMELLHDPETCERFRRMIEQNSPDLLPLLQPPPANDRQHGQRYPLQLSWTLSQYSQHQANLESHHIKDPSREIGRPAPTSSRAQCSLKD